MVSEGSDVFPDVFGCSEAIWTLWGIIGGSEEFWGILMGCQCFWKASVALEPFSDVLGGVFSWVLECSELLWKIVKSAKSA